MSTLLVKRIEVRAFNRPSIRDPFGVLQRDHGVADIRFWRKSYLGVPSPYAEEMAQQCDAVINGVGH